MHRWMVAREATGTPLAEKCAAVINFEISANENNASEDANEHNIQNSNFSITINVRDSVQYVLDR